MANNKLSDLNNHLFAQLERLSDEDLKGEELTIEISRSKAVNEVAKHIVENAKTSLDAMKYLNSDFPKKEAIPDQFKLKS